MKSIACENAKELAQDIHNSLKTIHKDFTLRPFNRFDMERSMWWIIPSKEFPAYKYGKYMVEENSDGTFSVGLHIEKGFEKALEYKEKLMLDSDWVWHDFLGAVEDGEISRLLQSISERVGRSVEINVLVDVPKIERRRKVSLIDQGYVDNESGDSVVLESLPHWIREIEGIEWYWVDFYIHLCIPKISNQSKDKWTDYDIVGKLLAPLEKWIR